MSLRTPVTPLQIAPKLASRGLAKAAALSMFAASGLILASPGSANAAACTVGAPGYNLAGLGGGFSCSIGDLTYSDFSFGAGTPNGSYTFSYDGTGGYQFGVSGLAYAGPTFTYQYKVALTPPTPKPGLAFTSFDTSYGAIKATTGPSANKYTFKKALSAYDSTGTTILSGGTLASDPLTPVNATSTDKNITTITGSSTSYSHGSDGPYTFAQPQVTDIVFKNVLSREGTGGSLSTFTDYLQAKVFQAPTVPGPLPILGAAAAFSFSRQLRRRIKLA